MNINNSLQNRYFLKLIATVFSAGLKAVILFIVPQNIGPEKFGIYNYLITIFSQFFGFLDAGTSTAYYVKLSQDNKDKRLIIFYFLIMSFVVTFTTLLFAFLYYFNLLNGFFNGIDTLHIIEGLILSFLLWVATIQIKTMDSYAHTVISEIIKISYSLFSFLIFMIIVYFEKITLSIFFQYLIFSASIYNGLLFYKSSKMINWIYTIDVLSIRNYIKVFYKYTHPLFVFMLVSTLTTMIDFWLLQKYGGLKEQGYYGLVFQIAAMSSILTTSMTPLISREFSKDYRNNKLKRMKLVFKKYIPQFYILSSFIAIYIFYYSNSIVTIIAGEEYNNAIMLLAFMAFYPLHQTYGQLSGAIFFATDKTKQYRNTSVLFMLIGIPVSYLLIGYFEFGALGLVIKVLLVQFLSVNYQLKLNCSFLKLDYFKFLLHQIYIPIILYVLIVISSHLISFENIYLSLFIGFILYFSLTFIIYFIWRKYEFIQKIQFL